MKVLITGANGQLGYCLQHTAPARLTDKSTALELRAVTRSEFDLARPELLAGLLDQWNPDVIINAAAYTAVDKAEQDQATATTVNADAVLALASWCESRGAQLVQVSTDFVFAGDSAAPYPINADCAPLSVYGHTKLRGEQLAMQACPSAYIVRTGWVYAEHGANFVKTMLRLGRERDQLGVVADQVGTPTYARHLADMIWRLLARRPEQRIHHFSDAGVASWYDFAAAIFEEAEALALLPKQPQLRPITTADYPTPAHRPNYSVLDKTTTWKLLEITPQHWRQALRTMLKNLKNLDQL